MAMPMVPPTFRRELEPPGGRHRQPRDLGDDGAEPAVSKSLLDAGEHRAFVAGLDIDDAVGSKASLGERRREQVRAHDAPQHLAFGAGGYPGGEERRGRAIDRSVTAAGDLVQRSQREPASGKARVERREPKGKHRIGAAAATLDGGDPFAQRFDGKLRSHASPTSRVVVPFLF